MTIFRNYFRLLLVCTAAVNVAALAIFGQYDVRFGPVHLFAHDAFKPLQYLGAALLVAILLARHDSSAQTAPAMRAREIWFVAAAIALSFLPSAFIDFAHPDWNQAHIGAGVTGLGSVLHWFRTPQPDGFYRPLGFLSLWLDYLLFGTAPIGYHLQSILIHAANAALTAHLGVKLGLPGRRALIAAALFGIAPICVEAVTWPAARYDVLSAFFVLAALNCAAACVTNKRCTGLEAAAIAALTTAGIFSKESAYAMPLLAGALALFGKPTRTVAVRLLGAAAVPTVVLAIVRLWIYRGVGGYETAHFSLSAFTRLLIIPFGVNTVEGKNAVTSVALLLLALAAVVCAVHWRSCLNRTVPLAALCAVLSALPVSPVLGWIGPSMLSSRYLYLSAAWIALLLAIGSTRLALVLFLAGSLAGTAANLLGYREALVQAEQAGAVVHAAVRARPQATAVCLEGVPTRAYGVLFFGDQVFDRARSGLSIPVLNGEGGRCKPAANLLLLRWQQNRYFSQPR